MKFKEMEFRNSYINQGSESLVDAFLNPALKATKEYKRSAGFFSSDGLIPVMDGLMTLARNGGHVKLIASPRLNEDDIQAIAEGYERRQEYITNAFTRDFVEEIDKLPELKLQFLCELIKSRVLDIKIVVLKDKEHTLGMYHDKMGILHDFEGDTVVFYGSANASYGGLKGNYERIRVARGWQEGFKDIVAEEEAEFDSLWNNTNPFLEAYEYTEIAEKNVIEVIERKKAAGAQSTGIKLRDYQEDAIKAWVDNGYHGFYVMATGTGKTWTAIYAQRQQLYSKRTSIVSRIESLEERLVTDAASELPLSLVRSLLVAIKNKAENEHDQKLLGNTLVKLEALFGDYDQADAAERDAIQKFIDYVRSTAEPGANHVFATLSDSSVSKLQVLLDSQLEANRKEIRDRKAELADLQAQMDQLDNYLSVEIDEAAINRIYRRIKELEQEQIALDVKIQSKEEECRMLNGKAMVAASVFKKGLEEFIRKAEYNDEGERVLKYAHMASTILDEYTKRLQQRKVAAVAETMTECYKQLANKTSLISHIEMDPVSLDLQYINPEGKAVDRASLSAGEKQLMVISLLWALARCSKKKLPVIIDTPLSRLDSAHRSSVIQTYFPQASEQTIILSTDTEIDQGYYELMRPNIGDEFTLVYNNETKSTTINRGYFPGV